MKTVEAIKIFLLGIITAFLAVLVFRPTDGLTVAAEGGAAAKGGDLMAVATQRGNSDAVLSIIDPTNKYIAQYSVDNARFNLRAARYFKNDLYITDINKKGGLSVKDAAKEAKKSMRD